MQFSATNFFIAEENLDTIRKRDCLFEKTSRSTLKKISVRRINTPSAHQLFLGGHPHDKFHPIWTKKNRLTIVELKCWPWKTIKIKNEKMNNNFQVRLGVLTKFKTFLYRLNLDTRKNVRTLVGDPIYYPRYT